MNNQKGVTLIELIIVVVIIFGIMPWIWNATKLASCDFEADWKCEVIHGVGVVVPPSSVITVWFDDDGA